MKVGDLVKRKPEWGEWTRYNPWMYTAKDMEVGIIVEVDRSWDDKKVNIPTCAMQIFCVLIGGKKRWHSKSELDLINESR